MTWLDFGGHKSRLQQAVEMMKVVGIVLFAIQLQNAQ